jgi:D-alanine-D-alanine ligase
MKRTVLVVFGGRSAEHEISILSARFVVSSLDRDRFEPVLCGIDPHGRWHWLDALPEGDARTVRIDESAPLAVIQPGAPGYRPVDIAFPVLHGPFGEDGTIQGLFEMLGTPYVGSGVTASAIGMDKLQQKRIFERLELPVAPYVTLRARDFARDANAQIDAATELGFPMFVKPANMGSSLGVSKATGRAGLRDAIQLAFEFDDTVLVERGLPKVREIEVAILGNDDPRASEPGEITVTHRDGFYSYDAKYLDDGAELSVPAKLSSEEAARVRDLALRAFTALGCAGLARVDMFVSEGSVVLNEVNTMPGFTSISMYPRLWQHAGIGGRQLVTRLVELGFERHARRTALRTSR